MFYSSRSRHRCEHGNFQRGESDSARSAALSRSRASYDALSVIARLRPGVAVPQSEAELTAIQAQIARSYSGETGKSVEVYTLQSQTVAPSLRTSIYVLWGAIGCVLLIVCVNVANLLLTRGAARRREVAIRAALGASRSRIVRLFLLESLILSLTGAFAGILFASLAVLLAAVGLYGVISYSTAQRTPEFGVRIALGAQRQDLIQSVLLEGLKPALIGMGFGLLGSLAIVRIIQSMLFEVDPFDAGVFASVPCAIVLVSLAAGLIPALRTTVIDPAQALRAE